MDVLIWVVGFALVVAIVIGVVQRLVKMAVVGVLGLLAVLTLYYLVVDNAPEPVAAGMEAAAEKVKDAGGKAVGVVGDKAKDVGVKVGAEVKEAGVEAAKKVGEAATKAGERIVDEAVQGAVDGAKQAVQPKPAPPPPAPSGKSP